MSDEGDAIVRRIAREAGVPDLAARLAALRGADLTSLLLAVHATRTAQRTPADVLRQHRRDRFTAPAASDPRRLRALEGLAAEAFGAAWTWLELAPLAPLGSVAALTGTSQRRVVSTARGSEAASDPTNVLALEAALRRRQGAPLVRLVASQRVTRAQAYADPALLAHFRLLGLVSGWRDGPGAPGSSEELAAHIAAHLRLLSRVAEAGLAAPGLEVAVTALDRRDHAEAVRAALAAEFPDVPVRDAPERQQARSYYVRACFHVLVSPPRGGRLALVDGGLVDWAGRLLADRRERLAISGVGLDLLAERLATPP